ncbi:MAG: NTP transferase domain-containing protein [Rhodospirillales bacterium]|nr:NTP transferase domain-containing protein [Rhodospirillales bacterium]
MQCLILAGGLGTRMQPVTTTVVKALVPVRGRPFADHQLTWLAGLGVKRVVYAIGHMGDQIRDFVGSGERWDLDIAYSDEGDQGLGTGGAVRLAVDEGVLDGGFLVLYGDSYLDIDIKAVWEASGEGAFPLMSVFRNDGQWDASNAAYNNGRITRFEKGLNDPAGAGLDYIDYGLSVLNADVVRKHIPEGEPFDLAQVYRDLAQAGGLKGFEARSRFYEIGSPQGLADLEAHLQS